MNRGRRPAIRRVGHVHDDGQTVTISGWALDICAARCDCHRHPYHRQIALLEDITTGHIGLVRYGGPCDCCQPWTFDELAATVRFFADVAALAQTS